ncbi:MAG: glucose-6-phosphate dehydrogenase [bacterium]
MNNQKVAPSTLVLFGGTGDLARRKLLPALYRLQALNMLPGCFHIVGFATRKLSHDQYRDYVADAVREFSGSLDEAVLEKLTRSVSFVSSAFDDSEGYTKLAQILGEIDQGCGGVTDKLFYLAVAPRFFITIIEKLSESGLSCSRNEGEKPPKVVIEKPFGRDLESARRLNKKILSCFHEDQVYRIDHYLGKETVQNILFFRFANSIYEPIWNRKYIDHVQITVSESLGVEKRGRYYDKAGALRDMVPNHMFQLLALVAMEPPADMEPQAIKRKKIDLFRSLRHYQDVHEIVVRGQYGVGIRCGEGLPAYREEENVAPDSVTETYVALKLHIDNWRWAGVPFYLRTGKMLKKRLTEIAIRFREVPLSLFRNVLSGTPEANELVLKIQPDEGISFNFNVKLPGSTNHYEPVKMDFSYKKSFKTELPEAYERLILDCILGDSTLFPHGDGIEAAWGFLDDIFKSWDLQLDPHIPIYEPGCWGPREADIMIAKDGRVWRNP